MLIRRLLLPILISACPLFADSFSIEQVLKAPFASSLTASPAGGHIAWVLNAQGRRNIWVADVPDGKGHQITAFNEDDGQEVGQLTWTNNGTTLLFTRGGDFDTSHPNHNPESVLHVPDQNIWAVDLNGTPARKLTEGNSPSAASHDGRIWFRRKGQIFSMKRDGSDVKSELEVQGAATDLTWSPDGTELAFTNTRGDHNFIAILTPGAHALRYLSPSVDTDSSPVWSPDGTQVAFLREAAVQYSEFAPHREGEPWSILVADAATGKAREVFHADPGPGSLFHLIASTKQLFWTAQNQLVFPWEKTGWCHLYTIPAAGGAAAERTPGNGIVEHVAQSTNRQTLYYSSNIGDIDRRHVWRLTSAQAEPEQLTRGENIEWSPVPVPGGNAIALLASSYNLPSHAAVLEGQTSRALAPQTIPSDFPAQQLVKPEPVTVSAADGMLLHAQLFRPSGQGRHPAIVFFHGGSRRQMLLGFHYMGYYSNAYALDQYFANHGYLVLSVNYRSGIGYGLNFREALHYGAAGASEFNDVQGAGLYLRSRSDVDPHRIGLWGGSYGGYLTALGLARASDLFQAGVDFHGVHDWNIELGPFTSSFEPEENADLARVAWNSSPLAYVDTWRSPVLLIHGDDDPEVAFSETIHLVEALRKQHVPFEQMILPSEVHVFLLWRDWLKTYQATAEFFDRKLAR